MKSVKIEGKSRSEHGKKATRKVRSEGDVPAVIYGGKETIHFSAPSISFVIFSMTSSVKQSPS